MRARFRKKESRSFIVSICAQLAFNVKTTSFWYDLWAGGNSVNESIKGGLFYEIGGEHMTHLLRKKQSNSGIYGIPRISADDGHKRNSKTGICTAAGPGEAVNEK